MATESTSSVDVFIENDPDGDKLVIRYKDGRAWFKVTCDIDGNPVITDQLGYEMTLDMSAVSSWWSQTDTP